MFGMEMSMKPSFPCVDNYSKSADKFALLFVPLQNCTSILLKKLIRLVHHHPAMIIQFQ